MGSSQPPSRGLWRSSAANRPCGRLARRSPTKAAAALAGLLLGSAAVLPQAAAAAPCPLPLFTLIACLNLAFLPELPPDAGCCSVLARFADDACFCDAAVLGLVRRFSAAPDCHQLVLESLVRGINDWIQAVPISRGSISGSSGLPILSSPLQLMGEPGWHVQLTAGKVCHCRMLQASEININTMTARPLYAMCGPAADPAALSLPGDAACAAAALSRKRGHHPPGLGHHVVARGHHPPGVGHHRAAAGGHHPPGVGHHIVSDHRLPGVGHHSPGIGHHATTGGHHPPGIGHHN
eukprot:SM000218S06596  [mRNA]  locus=s218:47087:48173:- [translate_table: standard]